MESAAIAKSSSKAFVACPVTRGGAELFFFSSRRRHTRCGRDWSSVVCSSDLVERVAILQGEEVLGAESLLRENERALHHGAAQVDGAADHGRGHLGAALEVRKLGGEALALEVAELLSRVEREEDERRRGPDLDRLCRLGVCGRRDHAQHGDENGDDDEWRPHDVASWRARGGDNSTRDRSSASVY